MQHSKNSQSPLIDRFIPLRPASDYSGKLDLLDELYETYNKKEDSSILNPNQENYSVQMAISEPEMSDPQRTYRSLLHNQILKINDVFTIHQLNGAAHIYNNYPYTRKFSLLHSDPFGGTALSPSSICSEYHPDKENSGCYLPACCGFGEEDHQLIPPIQVDRKIPKVPFKVLDAPALQDDFYLNVVDWSSQGILAVGLGSCTYLWSAGSGKVTKLNDVGPGDSVTSLGWSLRGNYLAVGTYSGAVQIWDAKKCKQIRVIKGHESRVGSVAWTSKILSTGSRDKSILHRDIRQKGTAFARLQGHKQEVCGLKWSQDEQQLASGGNDNKLLIWSASNFEVPCGKYSQHSAAVKALAWSPHQHGLLASGGGTADRCIRFWNTLNNSMLNVIDTGSQVCSLMFAKNMNELVSTHGYSQNQIVVWKYPNMRKLAVLTGHTYRVLYLSASNDGESIVTGAGDETLRFWRVFPETKRGEESQSMICPSNSDIR